jgi:hypothetical protein
VAFIVYFIELKLHAGGWLELWFHLVVFAIFVSVALIIRLAGGGGVEFSSLDFLLLTVALIISFFFKSGELGGVAGYVVMEIMVLFYAVNILFNRQERREKLVMGSMVASLLIIGVKFILL